MTTFLSVAGFTALAILLGAGLLHLIPKLGAAGKSLSAFLCRAPGLDLVVTYFTVAPLFFGPIVGGWRGLAGAVVGQVAGMLVWQWLHELAHLDAARGPRIVKVLNRLFGRWRNHTAVWLTAIVTPLFWCVRVVQVTIYPLIVRLVNFPSYNSGEWVNVSRHKFSGLVGHDLIWCLYCDWMTGVWSLGSEMLRNVESFWCPIRFDNAKKCANCAIDFPDVAHAWVPAHATIADAAAIVDQKFSNGQRGWFGHPARLTVAGRDPESAVDVDGNRNGPSTRVTAGAGTGASTATTPNSV
jgi:hypothetical protein